MIVLPLAFTFVFGVVPTLGGTNNKIPVAVVDQDHSALSASIIGQLKSDPAIQLEQVSPNDEDRLMRQMKVSVIMSIPAGFEADAAAGRPMTVGWTAAPNVGGNQDIATATASLQTSIRQWMLFGEPAMQAAIKGGATPDQVVSAFVHAMKSADKIHPLLSTKQELISSGGHVQTHTLSQGALSTMGFSVMFIVFTVFGSTSSVLNERITGTWKRMLASPMNKGTVVAGYGIAFFVMGWIQYAILVLASRFIFGIHVPWNGWIALVVSLYVLAMCGIALCVANLVQTTEQQMGIGSFVAIGTCMIGGVYWPLEIEPTWMQHLAWFVPQSWTMKAFDQVTSGTITSALWLPLGVLAAFAAIFYVTGIVQLRYST